MELLEQDKTDKKDRRDKKRRFQERMNWSDIPVTGDNAIDASKKKKKSQDYDISGVIYYNCNKKGYFANIYTKPKN